MQDISVQKREEPTCKRQSSFETLSPATHFVSQLVTTMSAHEGAPTLSPPTHLPPSIIRSSSLSPARPMPSPRFDHPSSHPSSGVHTPLSPSPATKGSILLNKPSSNAGSTPASPTMEGVDGSQQGAHGQQWGAVGGAALRSPISLEGAAVGDSSTQSPTGQEGQQQQQDHTSHTLSGAASYFVEQQQASAENIGRPSRSPSPHCHFAPLPKVEGDRPGTRRNSAAQRQGGVRPFTAGNKETSGVFWLLSLLLYSSSTPSEADTLDLFSLCPRVT